MKTKRATGRYLNVTSSRPPVFLVLGAVVQVPGVAVPGPEGQVVVPHNVGGSEKPRPPYGPQEHVDVGAEHAFPDILRPVSRDGREQVEPQRLVEADVGIDLGPPLPAGVAFLGGQGCRQQEGEDAEQARATSGRRGYHV